MLITISISSHKYINISFQKCIISPIIVSCLYVPLQMHVTIEKQQISSSLVVIMFPFVQPRQANGGTRTRFVRCE